VALSSRG